MQTKWLYIVHWVRVYYGIYLLYSGVRYALTGFVPEIPGVGGQWVQANADIYIYQFVKYLEIVAGVMILTNRFPLLGLILEMPTTVNVFWLNTFIVATPRQLFTGPHELVMNGFLLLAYSGWIYAAVKPKLQPLWLWDHRYAYQAQGASPPEQKTTGGNKKFAVMVCVALTAVLFIGSTGLFYAEYRPIRNRDLTAYVGAWIWMLYLIWKDKTTKV
ncbi:hypothetical protein [Comamonas sp. NoAH]|uniref:hypothetical protein n=1 Tax=Comamonas halotolerans TaxID=3041496 RepID=UPI0024E114E6|nr:hypothetical protein [Comamonas sp. NoAH]